jgi:hypothetical protein
VPPISRTSIYLLTMIDSLNLHEQKLAEMMRLRCAASAPPRLHFRTESATVWYIRSLVMSAVSS